MKMKFKCNKCTRKFSYKKNLYAHERKSHKLNNYTRNIIKNPDIKCDKCATEFCNKKNLYVHLRRFHEKDLFKCEACNRVFVLEYELCRHQTSHQITHKSQTDHSYTKGLSNETSRPRSRLLCPHDSCTMRLSKYENLDRHLNNCHNVEINMEEHEFTSLESFRTWKDHIQKNEMSHFSQDSGPKKLATKEAYNIYYFCRPVYFYTLKGAHKSKNNLFSKSMITNKDGKPCPSRMKVTMVGFPEEPSLIKVQYWKTHYGHEIPSEHAIDNKTIIEAVPGELEEMSQQ